MLFSRLKGNSDRDVFIDDAIATLNTNGHQNVAGLRLDMQQKESEEGIAQSASSDAPHTQAMMLDARLPQINGSIPYGGTQPPPTLAIDFLPPTSLPRQRPTHLPRQSYAAILTMSRGCSPASRSPVPILDYSSAPTVRIQNLYTPLRFPLITSFPSSITGSQSALAEGKSLALSALLSTGGGVGAYISGLREVARGLMDVEVREVMVEELGRLKEGYVEGWGDDEEEEEDYDD